MLHIRNNWKQLWLLSVVGLGNNLGLLLLLLVVGRSDNLGLLLLFVSHNFRLRRLLWRNNLLLLHRPGLKNVLQSGSDAAKG